MQNKTKQTPVSPYSPRDIVEMYVKACGPVSLSDVAHELTIQCQGVTEEIAMAVAREELDVAIEEKRIANYGGESDVYCMA